MKRNFIFIIVMQSIKNHFVCITSRYGNILSYNNDRINENEW